MKALIDNNSDGSLNNYSDALKYVNTIFGSE